ncbi:hypothetical protein SCP_0805690 [Sparassis crispa]|uniref:Uncharacterized protein n=1 Tax=Sparassis crispa TaxID=139825 RepID=A0A401GUZ5_9APHY|nr:hypothetical protein SCP_0805690 [Sparassis crispa]GBE86045.1 hypothetical protein SCP_0805690 [Sparassis crispa]
MSLINRLPPDVLSIVFHLVPDTPGVLEHEVWQGWNDPAWSPRYVKPGPYVKLTHVCRLWRDLALSLPTIWANIVDSPSVNVPVDVLVRRSRTAPLNVYLKDFPGEQVRKLLSSPHNNRIRTIWWEAEFDESTEELVASLSAPSVESVTLICPRAVDQFMSFESIPLLNGHMPCIKQLCLSSTWWLSTNSMSSLTQLHIAVFMCTGFYSEVLSVLDKTPNLVDLILTNVLSMSYSEPPMISLPKLCRITLSSNDEYLDNLPNILSCLSVADTTALRTNIFSFFEPGAFDLPAVQTITKVCIKRFQYSYELMATGELSGTCIDTDYRDFDELAKYMIRALPLARVRELWVIERFETAPSDEGQKGEYDEESEEYTEYHECDKTNVASLLPQMPMLEELVVLGERLPAIINALLEPNEPSQTPLSRSGLTVRIIMQDSNVDIAAITSLVVRLKEVGVKCVVIGYHRFYTGPQFDSAYLANEFQSVEFAYHETFPRMDLPPVCTTSTHLHWPSWLESWSDLDAPSP